MTLALEVIPGGYVVKSSLDASSIPFESMIAAMLPDVPEVLRAMIISNLKPQGTLDMVYNSSAPHKLAIKVNANVATGSVLATALVNFAPSLSSRLFSMTFDANTGAGRRLGTSMSQHGSQIQLTVVDDNAIEIVPQIMEASNVVITAGISLKGISLGLNATVGMLSLSDRGPIPFSASAIYEHDSATWVVGARAMTEVVSAFGFSSLALSGMEASLVIGPGP